MSEKCLLIKTKDNRKFLTHENHLPSLVEFTKTFGAEIYLVEPGEGEKIYNKLKPLTVAICNPLSESDPDFQIISKIYPENKRDRKSILTDAKIIRQYIQKKLLSKKSVSLKELKEKYKNYNLTDACLCNHLAVVRKSLINSGHTFRKVAAGKYCLAD